ncbi:hypothetical protein GCM10010964_30500 [Caldovatus sediminis]|uniref:DUF1800 domain-containing protein n=1 Tax=Caldovatus sediminis TaxID=2041189 RepID=A0A8J3EDA2_9PROT|nr:DUF1800 domain-containing protein [Caldovatus sediminis]GGG40783.1 hypothetical protein GCM10010964_30500 [Caldovatus sediminis]
MKIEHAVASVRFGLGRRPGDPVPADPVAWLERHLDAPAPLPGERYAGVPDAFAAIRADRETSRAVREAQAAAEARAGTPVGRARPSMEEGAAEAERAATGRERPSRPALERPRLTRAAAIGWLAHSLEAAEEYHVRLTNFWLNHFAVSRRNPNAGVFLGDFLRSAIRPHVTGRFADMLLAVVRHPAMLIYLDNAGSVGPNSPAGRRRSRGLNENLAREILELHTLSPAAGYTQTDVTEFARILTGWSVEGQREPFGFVFRAATHEPGEKILMGRRYPEGEEGGIAALRWLAQQPATHRHLATKLARHFVADEPPAAAVDRIFAVLRDTRGDLGAAARALLRLPEAWSPPLTKLRTPLDYALAVLRALDAPAEAGAEIAWRDLPQLGQPLWLAPAPNGWPDRAADWAAPEGVLRRVEWAHTMAGRGGRADARALAEAVLGPLAHADTLREAGRAGSARDALTLVLASPEFQRR